MVIYDVLLQTPLGKKKGELNAKIENGALNGFLSLLGHTEPVEGSVDENGNCTMNGKIVSLMRSIHFVANGTIDYNAIRLTVKGDAGHYEMIGQLRE